MQKAHTIVENNLNLYEALKKLTWIVQTCDILVIKFFSVMCIFSKFSAPTIAFLAFWLAKKLRLWANSRSFTSYGK